MPLNRATLSPGQRHKFIKRMLPAGSRRSKIRPPKRPLDNKSGGGESSELIFDQSWSILSGAIALIQRQNVSSLSYEQLYRKAYQLVLAKQGAKLYDNVAALVRKHLDSRRRIIMLTYDRGCSEEDFVKAVLAEWNDHLQAMKFISDVLMYLNRVYVKESKRLLTYELGILIFKDAFIKANDAYIGRKITEIVIEEISKSRRGEVVFSTMQISEVISMLELLTEVTSIDGMQGENYYQCEFEPVFLASSETFYYKLSLDFSNQLLGTKYVACCSQFITDEEQRLRNILPVLTYPKVISLMENILVKDKIDSVISLPYENQGLAFMVQPLISSVVDDNTGEITFCKELELLYDLVGRVEDDYNILRLRLRSVIIEQGMRIITHSKDVQSRSSGKAHSENKKPAANATLVAVGWIEGVLQYHRLALKILSSCFRLNPIMSQTIISAIREFINAPLRASGGGLGPAELLSIYMDHQIKNFAKLGPTKVGAQVNTFDHSDNLIDNCITFLRYIRDKDAFEANYANHFARRFLTSKNGSSVSSSNNKMGIDLEEFILSKLSEELGSSSLEKILRMNKDIKLSEVVTQEWKKHSTERSLDGLIEMDLKICSVTDWPNSMTRDHKTFASGRPLGDVSHGAEARFAWPRQLKFTMKAFEEFWLSEKKNHKKSLYWSPKFGSMDFRISYPSRTYEFNMSTYAGIIMLLFAPNGEAKLAFEEKKELTFAEIRDLTRIPEADLKRQLQSIAVAPRLRLLIKIPMTKDVNEDDKFRLNEKFTSPSIKIKVLTVSSSSGQKAKAGKDSIKTEHEADLEEVKSNVAAGRKLEVNAALVRMMKSRQTMKHHELVEELIKQLMNRFQPLMSLIKQRIEDLIEKEYLKRDTDDRNVYHYIA